MRTICLDAALWESRTEARKALHDALELSEDYASNQDALYDALTEARDIELTIDNADILREKFDRWGNSLLRMLQDAAEENEYIRVTIH